jgi:ferric-dicitrate binding protein FerR (iron transport regulator)
MKGMKNNLVKFLLGECDEKESSHITKLLNESPEIQKEYEELKKVWWTIKQENSELKAHEVEEELEKYMVTLENLSSKEPEYTLFNERQRTIPFFVKVAAVIIVSIGLGSVATYLAVKQKPTINAGAAFSHQVIAPIGSKSISILPDGTKVWLNAGSKLKYSSNYGIENRDVELEGEAYFKVVTNPEKPFIVITSELKIKAYGTAFNVKAYPDERVITTTLEEGKVSVEGKGIDITLKPRQNISYERREFKKANNSDVIQNQNTEIEKAETQKTPRFSMLDSVNTIIYTAWKDDKWIIESETLPEIAILLNRKFNVQVKIESEELYDYTFRGKFSNETLEQILNIFRLTAPIEYNVEKGIVSIKLDKKRKAKYQEILKE